MKGVAIGLGIVGAVMVAAGAIWLTMRLKPQTRVPTTPGWITVPNAVGPGRVIAAGSVLQVAAAVCAIWA